MSKKWWLLLIAILILIVLAKILCGNGGGFFVPTPTLTATFTSTPFPTNTNTPSPIETLSSTPTMTSTSTLTPTPTPTEQSCFTLISPPDGSEFGSIGLVTFQWFPQEGADFYLLIIRQPSGYDQVIESIGTSIERFFGSIPLGGEHSWQVTAFDDNSTEICSSILWGFTKSEYVPPPTSTQTQVPIDGGDNSCPNGEYHPDNAPLEVCCANDEVYSVIFESCVESGPD